MADQRDDASTSANKFIVGMGSPPALQAIGQVVVNASIVDTLLRMLVWRFARMPERLGDRFTEKRSIDRIFRLVEGVVVETQKDPRLIADIKDIIATARALFDKRNDFAHHLWGQGDSGPMLTKFAPVLGTRTTPYAVAEITAVAEGFAALLARLVPYMMTPEMWAQLPPEMSAALRPPWLTDGT